LLRRCQERFSWSVSGATHEIIIAECGARNLSRDAFAGYPAPPRPAVASDSVWPNTRLRWPRRLHLIWSSKPQLILHQVYAVRCIAQIVQGLRVALAVRAEVDPFEVSRRRFLRSVSQLTAKGEADPLGVLVERGEVASILRPSRRTHVVTPPVDAAAYLLPPPEVLRFRTPRYAYRRSTPRPIWLEQMCLNTPLLRLVCPRPLHHGREVYDWPLTPGSSERILQLCR
jgi:hypothetical protein